MRLADSRGRQAFAACYAKAPAIVAAIHARPDAPTVYRDIYDRCIGPAAAQVTQGDPQAAAATFCALVDELDRRFGGHPADGP